MALTIESVIAKINSFFRDNYNGEILGTQLHEVTTDLANLHEATSGDGYVIPKGVTMTIENEYQFVVANTLKVAGTIVLKGDLIIT